MTKRACPNNLRVLVVGGGAREHALVWKITQSTKVGEVIWCPGSDAVHGYTRWAMEPWRDLSKKAKSAQVDLVVIGPDGALAEGAADAFRANGIAVFGPSQAAAVIESSKSYAKNLMREAHIPTAAFEVIRASDIETKNWLNHWPDGAVVKADGLALGKGVVVCESREQIKAAADKLFQTSASLVIEERVMGDEVSCFALCDGAHSVMLGTARDYKRLLSGQRGPNTGGMGALSPAPNWSESWQIRIQTEVVQPVLDTMRKRGTPFIGVLFVGLMVNQASGKYWVLEFNARFGDPETQALLPRWKDDAVEWFWDCALGQLDPKRAIDMDPSTAVYVVGAAPGYPDAPTKGILIPSLDAPLSIRLNDVFVAGIENRDGRMVTSGGRVFGGLGVDPDSKVAREKAFHHAKSIAFEQMVIREDVGL